LLLPSSFKQAYTTGVRAPRGLGHNSDHVDCLPRACRSASATGARLTNRPGMIVTLSGDLGAGKTTLVRGCLRKMGWTGAVRVRRTRWLNTIVFEHILLSL
jgi:hypothetical protein